MNLWKFDFELFVVYVCLLIGFVTKGWKFRKLHIKTNLDKLIQIYKKISKIWFIIDTIYGKSIIVVNLKQQVTESWYKPPSQSKIGKMMHYHEFWWNTCCNLMECLQKKKLVKWQLWFYDNKFAEELSSLSRSAKY